MSHGFTIREAVVRNEFDAEWRSRGACFGMAHTTGHHDLFFPTKQEAKDTERAKLICSTCPVRLQCLDFSLREGIAYGVWGGMAERGRRKLRTKYNGKASAPFWEELRPIAEDVARLLADNERPLFRMTSEELDSLIA